MILLAACGAPPATVAEAPREPDVRAVLPEGASLIALARPRELFDASPSARVIRGVVPDAQLESIRIHHGIDLRTLEHAAYASYETGESAGDVIVLQGPFRSEVAVGEIAHRMVPRESSVQAPYPRAGGVMRGTRIDAVGIGAHTLVIVIGPPALTARVLHTLQGASPPAIAGPVAQAFAARTEPLVAMRPIPLALPIDTPVGMLFAEEESLVVAAAPTLANAVRLRIDLSGHFPDGAEANFRRLIASIAQSTMGMALGLRSAVPSLQVSATDTSVVLSADLDADEVARGLGLLFRAEIADVLGDPGASDTTN